MHVTTSCLKRIGDHSDFHKEKIPRRGRREERDVRGGKISRKGKGSTHRRNISHAIACASCLLECDVLDCALGRSESNRRPAHALHDNLADAPLTDEVYVDSRQVYALFVSSFG